MNYTIFLNQVAEFHLVFRYRQPEPASPDFEHAATNELRPRLIYEEIQELKQAIDDKNRVEQLDALCDAQYVVSAAVLAWGLRAMWTDYRHVMKLAKIRDVDGHLAAMLGLNSQLELAARLNHGMSAFKMLVYIQERLTQAVYHLGFVECFHEAFTEVHRSNLSKVWKEEELSDELTYAFTKTDGGWIANRADGKIIKSPSYSPANLASFI